jgi:uncharacterized protein GlcG (DUF336 family)
MRIVRCCLLVALIALVLPAFKAQQPAPQKPVLYGAPISLEKAKRVAAAAAAEADKNGWLSAIAIVDPAGNLVYFQRADSTQTASLQLAIDKARSSALFKRSTKVFEDQVAAGGLGLRQLKNPDVIPIEGGIPLLEDGKVVGAIGVSGGTAAQDGQCAAVGAALIH